MLAMPVGIAVLCALHRIPSRVSLSAHFNDSADQCRLRACCCSRFSSSAALEEKAKLRRRVCRLQHARGRDGLGSSRLLCVCRCCGGHGHRGSGRFGDRAGLQNHDVLLDSQPAASASAARPIHCDRSAPDGKRAEPVERRNSDDDPRGVRAAAARRRCGVCIERLALGRMAGLSVRWCCRQRGEHGALRARHQSCSFCAMAGEALRCEVDHEVRCRRERGVCDAQHRDTTRSNCGGVRATASRVPGVFAALLGTAPGRSQASGPSTPLGGVHATAGEGPTRTRAESRQAAAACKPRAAPPGFVRHSPARQRRRLSSPTLRH